MDTAAFDKFRESFKAFEEQVKAVNADTKKASKSFVGVSASTERVWASVSKHTKTIAGNIASATRSLLRWAEIGGIISGLLGVGSLWGLDRLANAAGNMRRNALGQNITSGEQRGFAATYGRLFDPGHFLGAVNAAMHDVTQRVGLYGAGLSESDIRGKDTGQVADLLVTAIGKIADATPDNMMAQVLKAQHLDQFMTLEDFERVKATPPAERAEYQKEERGRRAKLKLSDDELKAWQKLQVQLHFAGEEIETVFIRALKPLAPHLEDLSKAFVGLFASLMRNQEVTHWIDEVAAALNIFATYVGKPEFETSVTAFVANVGEMAKSFASMLPDLKAFGSAIAGIGHVIGAIVGPFVNGITFSHDEALVWNKAHPDQPMPVPPETPLPPFSWWNPGSWIYHSSGNPPGAGRPPAQSKAYTDAMRFWDSSHSDNSNSGFQLQSYHPGAGNSQPPGAGRTFRSWGDLLYAVEGAESSHGRDPTMWRPNSAKALGWMQITPDAWHDFATGGQTNPLDRLQAWGVAKNELSHYAQMFDNDIPEMLAAYNWGPAHVRRVLRQYGANWRSHLPKETTDYLNKILRDSGGRPQAADAYQQKFRNSRTQVDIRNNTGGNATVTAAQLAA